MVIIVHHAAAWEQAVKKYYMVDVETPKSFPVLVVLQTDEDSEAIAGETVITPEQAAKLLSVCTEKRILAIPIGIRQALAEALPKKKEGLIKVSPLEKIKLVEKEMGTVIVAVDEAGKSITYSGSPKGIELGDSIEVSNGGNYTVTQIGNSLVADDPIDGVQQVVVAEDPGVTATIPGLEEIPIDIGKLDTASRVADLGNPTEHVLDVERAV
jgi:hypothetical protein